MTRFKRFMYMKFLNIVFDSKKAKRLARNYVQCVLLLRLKPKYKLFFEMETNTLIKKVLDNKYDNPNVSKHVLLKLGLLIYKDNNDYRRKIHFRPLSELKKSEVK
ncbi:hypothetical protein IJJ97_03675 [bacterium]|nr:hypothetical protein [bacterium]